MRAVDSNRRGLDELERGVLWLSPEVRAQPFPSHAVSIGRGEDCGYSLPGAQLSRCHAEFVAQGGVTLLRDLQSTNGTYHNGRRIDEAILARHDVVRLGEWVGLVYAVPHGTFAGAQNIRGLWAGPAFRSVLQRAEQVAGSDIAVILVGESGTGKEVLARYIHGLSGREGALVAVNCAALPEGLAEAELFGYRRGAFTGADRSSLGHLRAADGGTLLLDEISELATTIQAKLLRAIEERAVTPLGETRPVPVAVRIIAAGQRELADEVRRNRFRGDLFARLHGLQLRLPPLRDRREEILPLFWSAIQQHSNGRVLSLTPTLVEQLCLYSWPFNVRELVQTARQVAALHSDRERLSAECLPEHIARQRTPPEAASDVPRGVYAPTPVPQALAGLPSGSDDGFEEIRVVLEQNGGNVSEAAKALGMSRQKLYRMIAHHRDLDLTGLRRSRPGREDSS